MKIKPVLMVGMSFGLWAVLAAGEVVAAPVESGAASAAVPRPPTAEAMARFLGFPKTFKFRMEKRGKSLMFEEAKPISVTYYSAEKQSAYSYSLELHKAGSLFNGKRAEYEKWLEERVIESKAMRREYDEEELIKYGRLPEPGNIGEEFVNVEVRPDGRKVFSNIFALGPGGGVTGVFTTVGEYDVLLLQLAFGGDGDDPEETERMRKMIAPTRSAREAFKQIERVMPIFPLGAAESDLKSEEDSKAAREAAIRAKPAPRPPTAQEMAQCLGFAGPIRLQEEKTEGSRLFYDLKPIWLRDYHAPEQLGAYYTVAIYPARSLFGSERDWFEGWLEHPMPFVTTARDRLYANQANKGILPPPGPGDLARRDKLVKQAELAKQKRLAKEAELRSPRFNRVEVRPDGRKVFFHTFLLPSGEKAPVVFSTVGNYDLVLMQIPSEEFEETAKRKPIAHRDVLQAFGELEKLFLR